MQNQSAEKALGATASPTTCTTSKTMSATNGQAENQDLPRDEMWIAYHRLEFESVGGFEDEQPEKEPVLQPGLARLVNPAAGIVLRGTLVDCPETQPGVGCVVVDTASENIAVQSPVLDCLVIEHAPCCLEFVAVPLRDSSGQVRWDWDAYELSPYGARILVSDPREEPPITPADQSSDDN